MASTELMGYAAVGHSVRIFVQSLPSLANLFSADQSFLCKPKRCVRAFIPRAERLRTKKVPTRLMGFVGFLNTNLLKT
jgi:hypothetical protein